MKINIVDEKVENKALNRPSYLIDDEDEETIDEQESEQESDFEVESDNELAEETETVNEFIARMHVMRKLMKSAVLDEYQ